MRGARGPRRSPRPQPVYTQRRWRRPRPTGGLPLVLDEKQLKVTLMLNVVKLLPLK